MPYRYITRTVYVIKKTLCRMKATKSSILNKVNVVLLLFDNGKYRSIKTAQSKEIGVVFAWYPV